MIKINIFRMDHFLQVVDECNGPVNLVRADGTRENISNQCIIQDELQQRHKENKKKLKISLDIPNARDYMNIINFSIADN